MGTKEGFIRPCCGWPVPPLGMWGGNLGGLWPRTFWPLVGIRMPGAFTSICQLFPEPLFFFNSSLFSLHSKFPQTVQSTDQPFSVRQDRWECQILGLSCQVLQHLWVIHLAVHKWPHIFKAPRVRSPIWSTAFWSRWLCMPHLFLHYRPSTQHTHTLHGHFYVLSMRKENLTESCPVTSEILSFLQNGWYLPGQRGLRLVPWAQGLICIILSPKDRAELRLMLGIWVWRYV